MSYLDDAAAELAKIRSANGMARDRARALRTDGLPDSAAAIDAEATATSFRLAEDYIALAALERDTAPAPAVTTEPGQE